MRGQSALEYLITYGWAIVAIAVIIMLLFYLGVFSPSQWVPIRNEAVGLSTFGVNDFTVYGNGTITLYLVNNAQSSVNLTMIKILGSNLTNMTPNLPVVLSPGTTFNVTANSTINGNAGDEFYSDKVEFDFNVVGGGYHQDSGMLRGKID